MNKMSLLKIFFTGMLIGSLFGVLWMSVSLNRQGRKIQKTNTVNDTVGYLKHQIINKKSMAAYVKLKALFGGKMKKEDVFYVLIMYDKTGNDTVYSDLRTIFEEIYNLYPKDTSSMHLIWELDNFHHGIKKNNLKIEGYE